MKMTCAACGVVVELPEKVGFRDVCPSCDAYLHSCVNCDFWVNNHCTEPSAEKVRDPEGINFCDWYRGIVVDSADKRETTGNKEAAEEMWKKLMKSKKEEG